MDDSTRFWAKVVKTDSCWLWTAATQNGYGVFSVTLAPGIHKSVKAHRWAYETFMGPIAHTLDHLCRTRHCVNPDHLEDVPMGVNNARSRGHRKRKTHCPRGHDYSTYGRPLGDGHPVCRKCDADKKRALRAQEKELRSA